MLESSRSQMQKYITSYQEYINYWTELQGKLPLNVSIDEVRCKFCYSKNIIRYGHFRGMQRWWCKDCQRKFADNGATPYMKTSTVMVSTALGMYYEGISLNSICRQMQQRYHNYFSNSTVYEWVRKYTMDALKNSKEQVPHMSDTWMVAVTPATIARQDVLIWDVMDSESKFIPVSRITTNHVKGDFKSTVLQAVQKAAGLPRTILAYGPEDYLDINSLTIGSGAKHTDVKTILAAEHDPIINTFQNAVKGRAKIIRARKDIEHARFILSGWQTHHNFFRLDDQLGKRTPSEIAGIDERLDPNWLNVIKRVREIIETWRSDYFKASWHS
jgi:putative transposase